MSSHIAGRKRYQCSSDCLQTGCPGHEVVVKLDCSTDIYSVEIDGKLRGYFDENLLHAVAECLGEK